MHLLYVVEFQVKHDGGAVGAFASLARHVAEWLSRGSTAVVNASDLVRPGSVPLPPAAVGSPADIERIASWEVIDGANVSALRVSVVHPLDSGVELTTRVTVSDISGRVVLRVGISRDDPSGALTPVRSTPVYQPGVVRSIAEDESLTLGIADQRIDERFHMVREPGEVHDLATRLRSTRRLPVVLVHTRSVAGRDASYAASRKLIGLAEVVTLNQAARRVLELSTPELSVPFGGATLVWSDLSVAGPTITSAQIENSGREVLRDALMPLLAPVSALARGVDDGWRRARQEAQRLARSDAEHRLRLAQTAEDLGGETAALREKIELLETDLKETESLAEAYAAEVAELAERAREAEDLQGQLDYWKRLYLGRFDTEAGADVDPWERIPDLTPAADPSDTFLALSDACDSKIVFTDNAGRSWTKIDYPNPGEMKTALVTLARAAQVLYGNEAITMGHVDDWFKTSFGLNVATSDDTIEQSKGLRYFWFEDQRRDQTPHVQVRDGVKPNEVGRIHFAFDSAGRRLIVNHVALKLYGR